MIICTVCILYSLQQGYSNSTVVAVGDVAVGAIVVQTFQL